MSDDDTRSDPRDQRRLAGATLGPGKLCGLKEQGTVPDAGSARWPANEQERRVDA